VKYSHIVARFGGVAKNPSGIRSWRRVVVTGVVASSVLVANLTVVGVSASSADQNSVDTSRVIVFASPAVGSDANYSLTIPLASSLTLPPVSDGVASDSFSYSLSGANSAGCALNGADATISFASAGSCVVVATSVPSDPDATYQMVKDLRTNVETSDTQGVLDGDLDQFMAASLAARIKGKEGDE